MSRVYGDSTPFPFDVDYIELVRDGIDCAVHLLSAHHSIRSAIGRAERAGAEEAAELVELNALLDRVQNASRKSLNDGLDRTVSTAAQLMSVAKATVEAAIADAQAAREAEVAQTRAIEGKARQSALGAIESFASRHAAPGTSTALQVSATSEGYGVRVTQVSPYGVTAVFDAPVAAEHPWARPRRVADFVSSLEINLPKESGWLSKRVEMAPVRLERFFVSEVCLEPAAARFRLTKAADSGVGYEFHVVYGESPQTIVREIGETGQTREGEGLRLDGGDATRILGLLEQVQGASRDLVFRRRRLIAGEFEGRPLAEIESPRRVADALIAHVAPVVCEISRRSGAPGELVLRRDKGEGRREETYCTHAELIDKIMILPPDLRTAFAPLDLSMPDSAADDPVSSGESLSSKPPGADARGPRSGSPSAPAGSVMPSPPSRRPPSVPPPESGPPAA